MKHIGLLIMLVAVFVMSSCATDTVDKNSPINWEDLPLQSMREIEIDGNWYLCGNGCYRFIPAGVDIK